MYPLGSVIPVFLASRARIKRRINQFSKNPAIASQSRGFYLNTYDQKLSEKGNRDEDEK